MATKHISQKQRVFEHLQKRPITSKEAERKYGITGLSSIISRLRKQGHKIRTDMVPLGNHFVARYSM